jgi:hypothetical protein
MSIHEREQAMDDWNSATSKVDVLVLNSSVSSAGLNCHKQCSVGIGLAFVWNVSTVLQMIGRLLRIGQQFKVTWFLPRVNGTINDWQEHRMLKKVCGTILDYTNWSSTELLQLVQLELY